MLNRRGAWIFVSHSLRDFSKVRKVRNALEALGHYPLLFFLRSLSDDAEVDVLIRREIEARNFFLLCDSNHARNSRWVQNEVKLIQAQPKKLFARLDLNWKWKDQLQVIKDISARMSIFVSSAADDRAAATAISDVLIRADYSILGQDRVAIVGHDIQVQVQSYIDEAMSQGIILVLLSPESLRRDPSFQWFEINYAIGRAGNFALGRPTVVPVVLRSFKL